jgi:radical SAM protein with 4Fe4S-binding SPASM domain
MANWKHTDNQDNRLSFDELVEFYRLETRGRKPVPKPVAVAKAPNYTPKAVLAHDRVKDAPCGIARSSLIYAPDGTIFPCIHTRTPLGNVFTDSLEKVWRESPQLKELREIRKCDVQRCDECPGLEYCHTCIGDGYAEFGDLRKPASEACMMAKARYAAAMADQAELAAALPPAAASSSPTAG